MHSALEHDMDFFIKKCARCFHNKQSKGHLFLSFCIQFFKQHVNVTFLCVLISTTRRKIMLASDAYFKHLIIIKSHDLHVTNIRCHNPTLG
jgi:hypothetical protein